MRSVKGIILGFLLILFGFAVYTYSLIASAILCAGGLAVVIIFALPKKAHSAAPTPAEPPAEKASTHTAQELPDLLTDAPAPPRPQPPAEVAPATLYQTLADAYTRIDALACRGPAWQLERDLRLCKAFCERWNAARTNAPFRSYLSGKVRYVDYTDEFLLSGFGKRGRIPGRRTSGDLLDDLNSAVLRQITQRQTDLQAALQAQKWFDTVKKRLRKLAPEAQEDDALASIDHTPLPAAQTLTRQTDPGTLDTFFVLAAKTTGKSPSRDRLLAFSIVKFRHFAPESILSCRTMPEGASMEQYGLSIDEYLGVGAPLILFRTEDLAFFSQAGSSAIRAERARYAVKALFEQRTTQKAATLADAFGALFSFVPALSDTDDEALACGLLFCELCDRILHLRAKAKTAAP